MGNHLDAYVAVRRRMSALALELDADQLAATVPACPDWTVHDLLAHNVAIPAAIAVGDLPGEDQQAWLDGLVARRRGVPVAELVEEWAGHDDVVASVLGATTMLLDDVATHEHDLRGATGRPDHAALDADLVVPAALELLAGEAAARGLGAIVVDAPEGTWRSHDAEPGWTLRCGAWEAFRAVGSRRTAAELRALPADGDPDPYVAVVDAHLPLPAVSLGEP